MKKTGKKTTPVKSFKTQTPTPKRAMNSPKPLISALAATAGPAPAGGGDVNGYVISVGNPNGTIDHVWVTSFNRGNSLPSQLGDWVYSGPGDEDPGSAEGAIVNADLQTVKTKPSDEFLPDSYWTRQWFNQHFSGPVSSTPPNPKKTQPSAPTTPQAPATTPKAPTPPKQKPKKPGK